MDRIIKPFCLLFAAVLLLSIFPTSASAARTTEPDGEIIGVANRGLWHEYPENSLEGVLAAAATGIDAVLADVSLTADGVPVLMEHDSASRMLDGAEKDSVSDYTLDELRAFPLRERSGGANNKPTEYKVTALRDALDEAAKNGIRLVLKADVSICDVLIEAKASAPETILYLTGNTKDVKAAAAKYGGANDIITEKRGNVIFVQTSFADYMKENGCEGVVLKTTNRYGVNFNQTLLKHFGDGFRAIADTSDPTLAGAREDTVKWWDDLISRGYSMIITDDPKAFAEYKKTNGEARAALQAAYTEYTTDWQLPQFGSILFNDYKKAYTDAVTLSEKLLADHSASTQDMNDCRASLIKACDDIDLNYEALEAGKAGMTVSAPRIALCVGAAVVVVAVQIFFFKRREKA